jgi:DNA-directed RNA polymerase subunit RPC12/RpoP
MGIVYFIQPYEFLNTNIYKIGRSKLDNLSRCINGYKEGSKTYNIYHTLENVKLEKIIIKAFKEKFKLAQGREYFEGDFNEMYNIFNNICFDFNKTLYLENKEEINEVKEIKEIKERKGKNKVNKEVIHKINKNNKIPLKHNYNIKIIKNKVITEYKCEKCNKKFDRYSNYNYHIEVFGKCHLKREGNKIECEYCKKIIISNTYKRHLMNYCKNISMDIRNEYIEKHNNRKDTKHKIAKNNMTKTELINFNLENIKSNKYFQDLNNIGFETIDLDNLKQSDTNILINNIKNIDITQINTIYKVIFESFKVLNEYKKNKNCIIKNISSLLMFGKINDDLLIKDKKIIIDNKFLSSVNFIILFIQKNNELLTTEMPTLNLNNLCSILDNIKSKNYDKKNEKEIKKHIKDYLINNNDKHKKIFKTKLGVI